MDCFAALAMTILKARRTFQMSSSAIRPAGRQAPPDDPVFQRR
jgi:hypothetical protein